MFENSSRARQKIIAGRIWHAGRMLPTSALYPANLNFQNICVIFIRSTVPLFGNLAVKYLEIRISWRCTNLHCSIIAPIFNRRDIDVVLVSHDHISDRHPSAHR
ncbi:hypothetical protein RF11_14004 [Thelohanellus kitauei]|uniref:Uncharacterized protein n=1 Tax=Thelohanellus kitauei TaxID=669202 RepID=A0A0C2JJ25_THEKT|nr:hypothetical protein RF11_14004 [Thelohanellus kitauei]